MAGKPGELSEKHWKALALFEQGNLSRKEVAAEIGVGYEYLNDLCQGNVGSAGQVALLFKEEYLKIQKKTQEETKSLLETNTKLAQKLIYKVLEDLNKKKRQTPEDKKIISMYTNALAKCTPNVSIGTLAFSYTKGMTPEELIHEFTRLKGCAESSFNRRRVQDTE
jgi:hypothetical protein